MKSTTAKKDNTWRKCGVVVDDLWFMEAGRNYFHISSISSLWKDKDKDVKLMIVNRELCLTFKTEKQRDAIYILIKNYIKKYHYDCNKANKEKSDYYDAFLFKVGRAFTSCKK